MDEKKERHPLGVPLSFQGYQCDRRAATIAMRRVQKSHASSKV